MKRALKIAGNVLIWIFVILAGLVTVLAITSQNNKEKLPSLFGKMPISVLSDSMSPTFKTGDMIICNTLTSQEKMTLKVDDVITFYADLNGDGQTNQINTHRISKVEEENGYIYYTTWGDNKETNKVADKTRVRADLVLGQYSGTKIPGLGSAFNFLQKPAGFLVCVVIPLILFFLYEIYRFIVVIISIKSKQVPVVDEEEIKRRAVEEYLANNSNNKPAGETGTATRPDLAPEEPSEDTSPEA